MSNNNDWLSLCCTPDEDYQHPAKPFYIAFTPRLVMAINMTVTTDEAGLDDNAIRELLIRRIRRMRRMISRPNELFNYSPTVRLVQALAIMQR